MGNYFRSATGRPYHLSVGAVLVNGQGEIACHYFKSFACETDFSLLMRETIEQNETVAQALKRGLMEEFGATGEVQGYIGSIVSHFDSEAGKIEKTTIYFLVRLETQLDSARDPNDPEGASEIRWVKPHYLADMMRNQARRIKRTDFDEHEIIENYIAMQQHSV